jgi:hypothetical protein
MGVASYGKRREWESTFFPHNVDNLLFNTVNSLQKANKYSLLQGEMIFSTKCG